MNGWSVIGPHRCRLGEGPVWDTGRQCLWFVDIVGREVLRYAPGAGSLARWPVGDKVGAIWPATDGSLVLAATHGFARWVPDGELVEIAFPAGEPDGNRFNDGAVDAAGRFWAGSMDDAEERVTGMWYRLDADGSCRPVLADVFVPNGTCWSPDGSVLYLADSPRHEIRAYEYDLASGEVGSSRRFAVIDDGYPDGASVDAEGYVWCAIWDGWRVVRFAPDGTVDREVALPVQRPTKPAFGGADLETLYVTSAYDRLTGAQRSEQPLAGALFAIDAGVRGLPVATYGGASRTC